MVGAGGGIGMHDATVDLNGNIWFTYFQAASVSRTIGKIDMKTGKVTNFAYPAQRGRVATAHGIYRARDGVIWFTVHGSESAGEGGLVSGGLGRIDPKTEKLEVFPPAEGMATVVTHVAEDGQGHIWASTTKGALRFDPTTRTFTEFKSVSPGSSYGVAADRHGNGWWAQIVYDTIGYSYIKTGKSFELKPPPTPHRFLQEGDIPEEDLAAYGKRESWIVQTIRPGA